MLVIMVIFIILATLGISALNDFKDGARFRSATLEFEKTIDEIRNLAKNNVVSRSNTQDPTNLTNPDAVFNVQIAGYYIDLSPDPADYPGQPLKLYSCLDGNFDPTIALDEIKCSQPEDWVLFSKENYQDITMTFGDTCEGIFFKNASADLYVLDQNISSTQINKSQVRLCFDPSTPGCLVDVCTVTLQLDTNERRVATYTFTEDGNRFIKQ
jgi:hypothetical protein